MNTLLVKSTMITLFSFIALVPSESLDRSELKRAEVSELEPLFPQFKKAKSGESNGVYQAEDIATYLLGLDESEESDHERIDPSTLQKLLYYIQGYHLSLFDEPIFTDEILHHTCGPLVWAVFNLFKGESEITEKSVRLLTTAKRKSSFSAEQIGLMRAVFQLKTRKNSTNFFRDTHRELPYAKTLMNQVMEKPLLQRAFREVESWLPLIIQQFLTCRDSREIQELIRYVREYISFSCLTTDSIDMISEGFKAFKDSLEKNLAEWDLLHKIKWPGQTVYQAFMGHLFFPLHYERLNEASSILNTRETLQLLISQSASFGNVLAMHHTAEIIKLYSMDDEEGRLSTLDCMTKYARDVVFTIDTVPVEQLPCYYAGLLCFYMKNEVKKAHTLFKRGFESGDALCGARYVLGIKNPESRMPLQQKLKAIDEAVGLVAEDGPLCTYQKRYANAMKSGGLGYVAGYHLAGIIAEGNHAAEDALNAYIIAARHHVLGDYEKVAHLFKAKGMTQEMLDTYMTWGKAGDPRGYVQLGEWFMSEYKKNEGRGDIASRGKAIQAFQRAGLMGLEKQIEYADTYEHREFLLKELKNNAEVMRTNLKSKLDTSKAK